MRRRRKTTVRRTCGLQRHPSLRRMQRPTWYLPLRDAYSSAASPLLSTSSSASWRPLAASSTTSTAMCSRLTTPTRCPRPLVARSRRAIIGTRASNDRRRRGRTNGEQAIVDNRLVVSQGRCHSAMTLRLRSTRSMARRQRAGMLRSILVHRQSDGRSDHQGGAVGARACPRRQSDAARLIMNGGITRQQKSDRCDVLAEILDAYNEGRSRAGRSLRRLIAVARLPYARAGRRSGRPAFLLRRS